MNLHPFDSEIVEHVLTRYRSALSQEDLDCIFIEACQLAPREVIELLVNWGANPNIRGSCDNAPPALFWLVGREQMHDKLGTLQWLINHGADPFAQSKDNRTLLAKLRADEPEVRTYLEELFKAQRSGLCAVVQERNFLQEQNMKLQQQIDALSRQMQQAQIDDELMHKRPRA
ncbi:MAG: hypothetical protein ACYCOU_08605 [Sulfobacillus sp.]